MKKRADVLLVEKGIVESRQKAKALILGGCVYIDNLRVEKAGELIDEGSNIIVKEHMRYVSRGGLKLEKALVVFDINVNGKIAVDIGASTGGFTDCLLQNGAKKVYCIDVGYGQLAYKLREDKRVICFEKTNIRYFDRRRIEDLIDIITCDVSFISLITISKKIKELSEAGTKAILLIKPQFEAGRKDVGKKGVVRSKDTHVNIISNVINEYLGLGFSVNGLTYSPIKGPEGNIEYLLYIELSQKPLFNLRFPIEDVVDEAFFNLK